MILLERNICSVFSCYMIAPGELVNVFLLTPRKDVVHGLWFCPISDSGGSTEGPEAAAGTSSISSLKLTLFLYNPVLG